jgi:hypothetical protein
VSGNQVVTYALDFCAGKQGRRENQAVASGSIPRIARLMALAIRFEELVRNKSIRDYAELARLGRVTRARMTQITRLLNLAPDIQEQILFLSSNSGDLNERILRPVVSRIDWDEQRLIFRRIIDRLERSGESA